MSFVRLMADGAQQAVTLIPLLFTLGAAPAHAQTPRAPVAQAVNEAVAPAADAQANANATPLLAPVAGHAQPTLVAQHLELVLGDGDAILRTTSTFRNDNDAPIAARYALPLAGAVTLHGLDDGAEPAAGDADDDDADTSALTHDCGGEPAPLAMAGDEFAEAGEPDPRAQESGVLWLAPGDEVTLVTTRPADVFRRDQRRRVVIVLPPAPEAQAAPQFSAEIDVDAPQPIVALNSATHGGEVDGLGGSRARLFVPNGKVYEARFLSVDLELGAPAPGDGRRWGNEDRLPIALR